MKRLVLDQMHSPSLTPKVTSFYLHELFILASSFTTSVPCTLFFSFPHVLSLRHPVSPLCHRVVGDTGAAGENPSYLQQQLLWPLWVSIEGAETTNNFLFIKKKLWEMLFIISLSPNWLLYLLLLSRTQRLFICCCKWKIKAANPHI